MHIRIPQHPIKTSTKSLTSFQIPTSPAVAHSKAPGCSSAPSQETPSHHRQGADRRWNEVLIMLPSDIIYILHYIILRYITLKFLLSFLLYMSYYFCLKFLFCHCWWQSVAVAQPCSTLHMGHHTNAPSSSLAEFDRPWMIWMTPESPCWKFFPDFPARKCAGSTTTVWQTVWCPVEPTVEHTERFDNRD